MKKHLLDYFFSRLMYLVVGRERFSLMDNIWNFLNPKS